MANESIDSIDENENDTKDDIIVIPAMTTLTKVVGIPSIFTTTWRGIISPLSLLRVMVAWGLFSIGVSFLSIWESFYLGQYMEASPGTLVTDAYGIAIAIGGITYVIAAILAGVFSDSIRTPLGQRIPFMITGAVCCGLVLLGTPTILERFQFGLIGFCLVVGVIHFFLGVAISPWNALLADLFSKNNRAWAALINSTCSALGFGIGLGLFEFVLNLTENPFNNTGWPFPWLLCGIFMIVFGLLSSAGLTFSKAAVNPDFRGIRLWTNIKSLYHTLRHFGGPEFGKMFWVVTIWSFCNYTFDYYLFLYITAWEFSDTMLLIALVGLAVAAVLSAVPSGWMAAKFGKPRTGVLAGILNAIFFVTLGVLAFTTNSTYFLPFALIVGMFGGLGITFLTTIVVSLPADLVPEGKEGMFFGIIRLAEGIALPFAAVIAGFAVRIVNDFIFPGTQMGYPLLFIGESLVWIVSIVFLLRMNYEKQSDQEYEIFSTRWLKEFEDAPERVKIT
ncbi:MAG: MFS transporter [Promethearchaeota archaeon]